MTEEEVRASAPECTRVARELRDVFGEAKIERLKEEYFELGRPDQHVYATCFYGGDGLPLVKADNRQDRRR